MYNAKKYVMPKFNAESSLYPIRYDLVSPKNYRSNPHPIISVLSSERLDIPKHNTEPAESGRRAWRDLERACDNLQCEECRKDCLIFINGLHDAINIKLGKSTRTPNDLVYLKNFINAMSTTLS
jgi:hypothetical protein